MSAIQDRGKTWETDWGTFTVVYRTRNLVGVRRNGWDMTLPMRLRDDGTLYAEDLRALAHITELVGGAVGPAGQWPPQPATSPN